MRDTNQPTTKTHHCFLCSSGSKPTPANRRRIYHRVMKGSCLPWIKGDRTFKLSEHEHGMELTRLPSSRAGTEPTALKFTVPDTLNRGHVEVCRWEEPWVGQTFIYLFQQVYYCFCTIDVVHHYLSHRLDFFQSSGHMPIFTVDSAAVRYAFITCSITKWGTLFRPCLSSLTAALLHRAKLC